MLSGSGATIRVLLADDHAVVRNGLRAALNAESDLTVVGEARDGLEAENQAVQLNPDVIVMDISMPRRDGVQSMISIKRRLPNAKVLFLTVSEREDDLLQAVRLGADGYVLKTSDLGDVVKAVRNVAHGEACLSPQMTATVMKELREGRREPVLSAREREVLEFLSEGLSN